MFYISDELLALRAELAAHNFTGNRLQIRYNPWNLGEVWVLNPITKTYILAAAVDPVLRGMTEYQWRVLKRAVRDKFDEPEHLLSLSAGRNAIRDVVQASLTKPSRRRRKRAARFLGQPPQADRPVRLFEADWRDVPGSESGEPLPQTPPDRQPVPADDEEQARPPSSPERNPPEIDPDDLDVDDWEVTG